MNINMEKTKAYYTTQADADLCDCEVCQLYQNRVRTQFPNIAQWLEEHGIDSTKPYEAIWWEEESGNIFYPEVQYIVFGSCEEDFSCRVDDVELTVAKSTPKLPGITDPYFVLCVNCLDIMPDKPIPPKAKKKHKEHDNPLSYRLVMLLLCLLLPLAWASDFLGKGIKALKK